MPNPSRACHAASFVFLSSLIAAIASGASAEPANHCEDHDPERNVYWGDLHVHTAISMDAYSYGARLRPEDAYRFARGERVMVGPLDESGRGTLPFEIDRPLDFAAVTDHAHAFGGVRLCTTKGSPVYDSDACVTYRKPFRPRNIEEGTRTATKIVSSLQSEAVCGPGRKRCIDASVDVWQETRDAAATWNDTTPACEFTTFVAYEHTQTRDFTKLHRNVIFANEHVPARPISTIEEPEAEGLWRELDRQCIEAGTGCDALAIPHNPNLSNGQMFTIEYPEGSTRSQQVAYARQRARMEPVVEIMQQKGESECRDGLWKVLGSDEECDFEKFRALQQVEDCKDGSGKGALAEKGCISRLDFARYALIEGMREADRIGVNPYAFGMIAATDIHNGAPGPVLESDLRQWGRRPPRVGFNPGGLAAVWAEENSRESIFAALRRREVYGTSGPRMSVRFFGGWDLPQDLCEGPGFARRGYAHGVAMGSDLPSRTEEASQRSPRFAVHAMKDAGAPATPLQRVQIVKGWADPDGNFHQRVIDIAGSPDNGASVDLDTCAQQAGTGADAYCQVWQDPAFDPDQRAVYYARVLENPSCRWAGWMCVEGREPRHPECDDPTIPRVIQERAWTSPIWYTPGTGPGSRGRSN